MTQLAEEGAIQVFRPLIGADYVMGAVGVLQFEVTVARLKNEYGVDAVYEPVDFSVARWIECGDRKKLAEFEKKNTSNLARDSQGSLSYLTTSEFQLNYCMEEWPAVEFYKTREIN